MSNDGVVVVASRLQQWLRMSVQRRPRAVTVLIGHVDRVVDDVDVGEMIRLMK